MTPEAQAEIQRLMMSPTMARLATLAQDLPIDPTDKDALRAALTATGLELIQALDAGRIHFDEMEDRAMFYGLLVTVMEVIFDGRFAARAVAATTMQ